MPSISRSDLQTAQRAAKAMSDLATGWGAASDAKTVASFLETAATNAPMFQAFADEFGRKDIWHPAQLNDFIESRIAKEPGATEWVGAGSPLGVRLHSLTTKPDKDLDPHKVGTELKNFATGWFNNEVLVLLLQQLPAVLNDPFAFEAMTAKADGVFKLDEGAGESEGADPKAHRIDAEGRARRSDDEAFDEAAGRPRVRRASVPPCSPRM